MAEVFIAKPGVLRAGDKSALRKAGIVVVEANHEDVKFIRAEREVEAGTMLKCALDALCYQSKYGSDGKEQREQFTRLMSAAFQLGDDAARKG